MLEQRTLGHDVLLVDYEVLAANTTSELQRVAAHWRLQLYLERAQSALGRSPRLQWERTLANRTRRIDDQIGRAGGMPSLRRANYSESKQRLCENITHHHAAASAIATVPTRIYK